MSDENIRQSESPETQDVNVVPESAGDGTSRGRPPYRRDNDTQADYGESSGQRREPRGRMSRQGRPFYRKKYCKFCAHNTDGVVVIDHKKIDVLRTKSCFSYGKLRFSSQKAYFPKENQGFPRRKKSLRKI